MIRELLNPTEFIFHHVVDKEHAGYCNTKSFGY